MERAKLDWVRCTERQQQAQSLAWLKRLGRWDLVLLSARLTCHRLPPFLKWEYKRQILPVRAHQGRQALHVRLTATPMNEMVEDLMSCRPTAWRI